MSQRAVGMWGMSDHTPSQTLAPPSLSTAWFFCPVAEDPTKCPFQREDANRGLSSLLMRFFWSCAAGLESDRWKLRDEDNEL